MGDNCSGAPFRRQRRRIRTSRSSRGCASAWGTVLGHSLDTVSSDDVVIFICIHGRNIDFLIWVRCPWMKYWFSHLDTVWEGPVIAAMRWPRGIRRTTRRRLRSTWRTWSWPPSRREWTGTVAQGGQGPRTDVIKLVKGRRKPRYL